MFNKKSIILLMLLLFIIIPTSFANDNNTAIDSSELDDGNMELVSVGDLNPKSVDYYFNSSADFDGDGSISNPYKTVSVNRIKEGSTIHLANGEYTLSTGRSLNKVSIIGQSTENTILRYVGTGDSGRFTVDVNNYVSFQNLTFIGFNFDIEGADFEAKNTIFKNSVAYSTYSHATNIVNSASNSFGGVIYAYFYTGYYDTYLPSVILDNCTFINNTAEYGGAIFINQGTLSITNSSFINNSAYNYGGAIVGLYDVVLKIKDSNFVDDKSVNDAGGAIYILNSKLSAFNLDVYNCSAIFGSAIASLNSTTALVNFNGVNNSAQYEGGVIYQIYNAISISDSSFKNNSARNGGAIYADAAEIFTLTNNTFENNRAENTAGAVFSILSFNSSNNNNTYRGNKARINDDYYESDSVVLTIGNGNYTLYFNNYTFDGNIPSSYNSADLGYVTSIKDQQSGGNCWAFSAIAALESAILKASGQNLDLSEENMKNLIQLYSDYGWNGIETNDGGYDEMAIGYLVSWLGPIYEDMDKYDDYSMLSPVLNSITHVQNIIYIGRDNYTDNDGIKEAIMKYGAVSTGIYYDSLYYSSSKNSYYYYGGTSYSNHAVAIVGWDDNYSKNNFYYKPSGDGAWIAKNSWDSSWGDNGYFYVSYYDTKFAEVGIPDASYAFVFNDTVKYDKNYQYDILGKTDYFLTGENTIWVENIFNATDNELLAGVSTYFRKTTDWSLFIYVNNQLALIKNGTSNPGYVTIDLGEHISLLTGDEFKVVFKLNSKNGAEFAISEGISANQIIYSSGISFFSNDGENWIDLYDYSFETEEDGGHYYNSQVAAIKAFTILYELQPSIKVNIQSKYNNVEMNAVVYDQYDNLVRSGEVTFNICGVNHTVKIENAIAKFTYAFIDTGIYDVNITYLNAHVNTTLNITKIDVNLNLDIIKEKDNVTINLESLLNINASVNVFINNTYYSVKLIDGKANLDLNSLDFGYYEVNVEVEDEYYAGDNNSDFNISISKTKIIFSDFIAYHNIETTYSIKLTDIYGNPVKNRQISFIIGGKSYVGVSDDNGVAFLNITLDKNNNYKMNIIFHGDDSYFSSSASPNIEVKSTINFLTSNNYLTDSKYEISFLNQKGNSLSKNQVNIVINGISYWLITDNKGIVSQQLNLKTGNYLMTVYNPETNEVLSKNINVFSRIVDNKNINVYFGSGSYYKLRVYGDDANFVGAGETVKITINSKTYYLKTDKNGYVSFKINLNPKSYTITASYKGFKVSNKIIVKPVLTAKNISKKKSKKIRFKAKLVNTNGKALKSKKLTFKFKGKIYAVKTNKKGIAILLLKNLKVGKYSITTKYGKSTIKNIIKIKS